MNFNEFILSSPRRLGLPISMYPGLAMTGAKVSDIVTRAEAQLEAQQALRERYNSQFVLTAMDLSVEAEAFGCTIALSDSEVPTVTARLVTSLEQADRLAVPRPGRGRTKVYLEAVRLLRRMSGEPFVFAGCIGPFSLTARLVEVSEAMELTIAEPELMHILLAKSTQFLTEYIRAFRAAGAQGVIMAEPAAGLLSPRGLATFSSAYIRRVVAEVGCGEFSIVLHNCAAKLLHLPAILETGLKAFHFGAPMDIVGALEKVGPDVVVCGNLDPASVFVNQPPTEVSAQAARLLAATAAHRNFVLSSGCDLPPNTPLGSLDAFYLALKTAGQRQQPAISATKQSQANSTFL
ncbi:MAG: methylcobamide--CoM methyltransferase [Verrucomicrobia bacterium]|nr:methylcobamide--CoM methyltransferase [Verrucomicrobiota bacterium]